MKQVDRVHRGLLDRIDHATSPAGRPSIATNITVHPSWRRASARVASAATSTLRSCISANVAVATRCPAAAPVTPFPVCDSNPDAARIGIPRSRAAATIAVASGLLASLFEAGDESQHLFSVNPSWE